MEWPMDVWQYALTQWKRLECQLGRHDDSNITVGSDQEWWKPTVDLIMDMENRNARADQLASFLDWLHEGPRGFRKEEYQLICGRCERETPPRTLYIKTGMLEAVNAYLEEKGHEPVSVFLGG